MDKGGLQLKVNAQADDNLQQERQGGHCWTRMDSVMAIVCSRTALRAAVTTETPGGTILTRFLVTMTFCRIKPFRQLFEKRHLIAQYFTLIPSPICPFERP